MPTPGATTTVSVDEIINSEFITSAVLEANRAPTVAEAVGWMLDASNIQSKVYTVPKWDRALVPLSEASPKAETVEFAATEQTLTETQMTAATVGIRQALSMEAMDDTILDLVAASVRLNGAELRDTIDTDLLSNLTSFTATAGGLGGTLDVPTFGAAIAAFKAANPTGRRAVAVLHPDQLAELKASMRATAGAIFGGSLGSDAIGLFDARAFGFEDMYEGVEVFSTSNVPEEDVSNWAGGLFVGGQGGPLAMAVWRGIQTEFDPEIRRLQLDVVTYARYGTALVNDPDGLKIISAKAP